MTTIVYNHKDKEIAVDSRVCCGGVIMTDSHNKVIKVNGIIFVLSGSNSDIRDLSMNYPEPTNCILSDGFMIRDGEVYALSCEDNVVSESVVTYNDASGDGYQFALAALDYGATAKEAIEYAMTRNVNTGGAVKVIKVK